MSTCFLPEFNSKKVKDLYYNTFYKFVAHWLELSGIEVLFLPEDSFVWCGDGTNVFSASYNGKQVIFDYGDAKELAFQTNLPVFKFHYCDIEYPENVFPFVPMLGTNWVEYNNARKQVTYKADGQIFCKQRPYGNALIRRMKIMSLLSAEYGSQVDCTLQSQEDYWRSFNDCFVSICVPGQREDILDRSQLEAMGLGVCTISPYIEENLFELTLEPWHHYIPVEKDFSDLSWVIDWCRDHRSDCIRIGSHAQKLFNTVYHPETMRWWIEDRIHKLQVKPLDLKLPQGRLTPLDDALLYKYGNGTAVDLGTYKGRSATLLAQKSKMVLSIDRFPNCDDPGYSFPEVFKTLKELAPNVYLFKGDSSDEANMVKDNSIDVIFIDADHNYTSVERDFLSWYPKVKSGGYVIFHDYIPLWADVVQCIKDYSKKSNLSFIEKSGYCIVFQKR